MTEKRFILKADYDWWGVLDTTGEIKGEYNDCFSTEEVVDLLNEQHETIEKLEKDNKEYIRGLDLSKATSQAWASDVRELREQNCQLEKENEQLKKELFESRCEYIYDTADISDKPYIDEEIEEMRKNIFEKGVYGID